MSAANFIGWAILGVIFAAIFGATAAGAGFWTAVGIWAAALGTAALIWAGVFLALA